MAMHMDKFQVNVLIQVCDALKKKVKRTLQLCGAKQFYLLFDAKSVLSFDFSFHFF